MDVLTKKRESSKATYGDIVCIGANARGGVILLAAQAAQRRCAGLVSVESGFKLKKFSKKTRWHQRVFLNLRNWWDKCPRC
ncbi:MAG: hypothetical protein ACRCZC_07560 [Culicoidibacterales bacterium]